MQADYAMTGLTLGQHPLAVLRRNCGAALPAFAELRVDAARPTGRSPGW